MHLTKDAYSRLPDLLENDHILEVFQSFIKNKKENGPKNQIKTRKGSP